MTKKLFNEAIINVDTEPADSVYSWYMYQKFISYFEKRFDEWLAFKIGLIDKSGKILRQPKTSQEKNALNAIANLVRKLKLNMLKHSSDSTIKIISYYLKYGFRTQDLALKECSSREIQFLRNFNSVVGFNNMLSSIKTEQATRLDFNGDLNFVKIFEDDGISVIKKLIGNVSIPFNKNGLSNFIINEFFENNDVSIVFEDFADTYKIITDEDGVFKAVRIHFPRKILFNSVEEGKVGEIELSDAMMFEGKNQFNVSRSSVYYNIVKVVSSYLEDGLLDFIDKSGINCAINIDVNDDKMSIYFRKEKIVLLSGKISEDRRNLSFDTIDNRMSDVFIMLISKQVDLTKFEETTGTGSLTAYAPPIGKKRRGLNGLIGKDGDDKEEEITEEELEKILESTNTDIENRFLTDFRNKAVPIALKNVQLNYNSWQTEEDGTDAQIKYDGICRDVADSIVEAVLDTLIPDYDVECTVNDGTDEPHIYAIIYLNTGEKEIEFHADIPYRKYENPVKLPNGITHWQKKYTVDKNGNRALIKFKPEDITIKKIKEN